MRVHGIRRRSELQPPAGFEKVFASEEFHDALASADHVVVTLPNTPRSRGMFDAGGIRRDEAGCRDLQRRPWAGDRNRSLIAALESGHLGGAGLDVTDPEPLPADSPLWDMENVLITAHTSGATPRYWDRQSELIAENIRRIQHGDQPRTALI